MQLRMSSVFFSLGMRQRYGNCWGRGRGGTYVTHRRRLICHRLKADSPALEPRQDGWVQVNEVSAKKCREKPQEGGICKTTLRGPGSDYMCFLPKTEKSASVISRKQHNMICAYRRQSQKVTEFSRDRLSMTACLPQ